MPIFKSKNENFFKKWTPEMAYVLGFFAADGYMIRQKRGGCYVDFYSTDKDLIEKIRKTVGSNHKVSVRRASNPKYKILYRLQFGGERWFSDLTKLGFIQNKSKVLRMPEVPKKFLPDFVRGYFDGDGNVSLGRYWRKDRQSWKWEFTTRFTSGSKEFLNDLWEALELKGGYLYEKNRGYELVFARKDSFALFDFMYYNIASDLYLGRKLAIFERAKKVLKTAGVA